MLENLCHTQSAFITLTYSDPNLSLVSSVRTRSVSATLDPHHIKNFLKRLRTHLAPHPVRFFAVGEYGDQTGRPHFHVVLYGYPTCKRGRTKRKIGSTEPDWENCCPHCKLIGDKWRLGNVDLGEVNPHSASYCAEYTLKKMTKPTDSRLHGRVPEFTRSSRRPGIGAPAMWDVANTLLKHHLEDRPDVPFVLAHGGKSLPLGRYLRMKLRKMIGKDEKAPQATLDYLSESMRPVREAAFNASRSLKTVYLEETAQKILNSEAIAQIFKARKNI